MPLVFRTTGSGTWGTGKGSGLTSTEIDNNFYELNRDKVATTAVIALANGGSGATTAQGAINAFAGAVTSGSYLRGNGNNVVMSAIQAADVPTLNQNTTGTSSNVTGIVALANGGTGSTTAAAARTALGATAVGSNVFTIANPGAITFLRINADNTVSTLDAATFRTAIGAGTSSTTGTVTSVSALTIGTTGTDISSTVANSTTAAVITLNIPTASASNRGALSAADWTTFNNKQPAGSYLTAESDTLSTVTGRGASTATAISLTNTTASTTATTGALVVSGGIGIAGDVNSDGTINAVTFNSTSDINFKKDLEKITNALDKVKQITGYTYTLIETNTRSTGLIAQEVEEILPESVGGDENKKTLSYGSMMGLIVEAIKDLDAKIDSIQKQISNK